MVIRRSDPVAPETEPVSQPAPAPPAAAQRLSLPPFCTALIAVCVVVYLGELGGLRLFGLRNWALFGPAVAAGQWWRVLTAVLVHAGPLHIFFNMVVVVNLGFGVERMLGTPRMLAVSLVSALGSAAMVVAFAFDKVTVGASGMILGWAGALLPVVNRQGRRSLASLLIQVAVISILPGVSWQGHLGGFLSGLACGGILRAWGRRFDVLWPVLALALAVAIVGLVHSGGLSLP